MYPVSVELALEPAGLVIVKTLIKPGGHRPVYACFLKIDSVWTSVYVCLCICVSAPKTNN